MMNPISAVQNLSVMVSCGSKCQTASAAVSIVGGIGVLLGDGNGDALDDVGILVRPGPVLDAPDGCGRLAVSAPPPVLTLGG
jgi:hypothetical protein